MHDRRDHAEQAFREARKCALLYAQAADAANTNQLRECTGTARNAAELSWEMPEHNREQLELQASLDELASALASGDGQRLTNAIERSSRAADALGWQTVHTRLH